MPNAIVNYFRCNYKTDVTQMHTHRYKYWINTMQLIVRENFYPNLIELSILIIT